MMVGLDTTITILPTKTPPHSPFSSLHTYKDGDKDRANKIAPTFANQGNVRGMQADSAATLRQYAHNTEAKHGKHRNDSGSDSDSNDSGSGEDDTDEGAFEHPAVDGKTEVVVPLADIKADFFCASHSSSTPAVNLAEMQKFLAGDGTLWVQFELAGGSRLWYYTNTKPRFPKSAKGKKRAKVGPYLLCCWSDNSTQQVEPETFDLGKYGASGSWLLVKPV